MFADIYAGSRILVTGHTGFKGSWLCTWLLELGAKVAGYSLNVPSEPANFEVLGLEEQIHHYQGDVRDRDKLKQVFATFQPEIVFHLAAQALVKRSYQEPIVTFETNTLGTMNVLETIRQHSSVHAAVIITSDKCYQNVEWVWGYRENDRIGGDDPYSASKGCAELIAASYMHSYFQNEWPQIATTRAGNVIGGGDWAADRIVPDCIRAWSEGKSVTIRNPNATRPWQHVLEPLSGYLWLGANLYQGNNHLKNESFNFGPQATVNQSVEVLIAQMAKHWDGVTWESLKKDGNQPEATLLKLSCDKALHHLGWYAVLPFEETVSFTSEWYKNYYTKDTDSMFEFTQKQIAQYVSRAKSEGLLWTN
ncbi:CDP-glucose 4,6-dehydratase [Achromatium sp. WMS3]|nr:CDP-glucose 4,6-dehydratase [Achromatium sp. WMS3]